MPTATFDLFVYGSLCSKLLRRKLLGKEVKSVPARLKGFAKIKLPGFPYPGLVRAQGAQTSGELLLGLTRRDLLRLDRYEGREYKRLKVLVEAQGERRWAFVYLWRNNNEFNLRERKALCGSICTM
jgi:gamma-glutamylcyclotransferase (GGCT)/AIG2-like uncharacterized protein YtfP